MNKAPSNPGTELMPHIEDAIANDSKRDRTKPLAPYSMSDLSVLAYANGFTLWHYKAQYIIDVLSENFFLRGSDRLAEGDHMHVSAPDGDAILSVISVDHESVLIRKLCV